MKGNKLNSNKKEQKSSEKKKDTIKTLAKKHALQIDYKGRRA